MLGNCTTRHTTPLSPPSHPSPPRLVPPSLTNRTSVALSSLRDKRLFFLRDIAELSKRQKTGIVSDRKRQKAEDGATEDYYREVVFDEGDDVEEEDFGLERKRCLFSSFLFFTVSITMLNNFNLGNQSFSLTIIII
ncbi:unnamed protein product [Vicia faba]|uniref:Uncharacterized protein n=1 Tax=Vicia faba TaxID=3906 RepID=A0AAV0Z8E3_VICFA|nr:unnamed protein product [Vicia faba]